MVERTGFEPVYGKPGQIYSLLPLTTRPPLQEARRAQWRPAAMVSTGGTGAERGAPQVCSSRHVGRRAERRALHSRQAPGLLVARHCAPALQDKTGPRPVLSWSG